tara:strand:+ start:1012 stop:2538 length:1527 start_codon:yes stop_codon:yes gene_type:complete
MSEKNIHPDTLTKVGGYNISDIIIINSLGEKEKIPNGVWTELNIYEDINNNAMTGSLEIFDSYNFVSNHELQGNERLVFNLSTPGRQDFENAVVDASEETGFPFYIYGISDRKLQRENIMTYTIFFCSNELARNTRTRINRALTGELGRMAASILKDPDGLNTKKKVFYEPTRNQDTIVFPNIRPFDALNLIARKALSGNAKGAGYYFYETAKAFHFRSIENMLAYQSTHARPPVRTLKFERPGMLSSLGDRKQLVHTFNVETFDFVNQFDSLKNQALGTYASRVITYNLFDKSYATTDYNFHREYQKFMHTDTLGSSTRRHFPIAPNPVDHDQREGGIPGQGYGDKTVSDYPESRVILQPSTRFLHNEDTGAFGTSTESEGLTEGIRVSMANSIRNATKLRLTVSGLSEMQAGDVFVFDYPRIEPNRGEKHDYEFDSKYSGRYLVKELRHRVTPDGYQNIITAVKDSVYQRYLEISGDNYPLKEEKSRGVENLYRMASEDPLDFSNY